MFSCNLPLEFVWQNDRDLLRATAVTRGWNGHRNKSQHRTLTLEKKILPPLLLGFEPATFRSWVRRSNHWAVPAPYVSSNRCQKKQEQQLNDCKTWKGAFVITFVNDCKWPILSANFLRNGRRWCMSATRKAFMTSTQIMLNQNMHWLCNDGGSVMPAVLSWQIHWFCWVKTIIESTHKDVT